MKSDKWLWDTYVFTIFIGLAGEYHFLDYANKETYFFAVKLSTLVEIQILWLTDINLKVASELCLHTLQSQGSFFD